MINQQQKLNFSVFWREFSLLAFLAVVVFLLYANSLQAPFTFDDWETIVEEPHLRFSEFSFAGVERAGFESYHNTRPVANISFALNYYFHQHQVWGYHLVNVVIHLLAGIFLYLFIKATLGLPALRSRYPASGWVPLLAVLLWLVHPVQVQSVTYIVQRMNSMAAMFYILSCYLYVQGRLAQGSGRKWGWFAGCALSGVLALGSKEIAATLPFFIVLYEWYFFQDLSGGWLRRRLPVFLGLLVFLAVLMFGYLGSNPLQAILSYGGRDFTLTERVLTELRVVIFYLSLLVYPHPSRLNLDHDFALSRSLLDPLSTLFSLVAIVALFGLAVYLARRERLLSFCILWFLGNLVIESSVIPLELVFEHRNYLPSMLMGLLAVAGYRRLVTVNWPGLVVVGGAVLVFSFWTYQRNAVWSDFVTLYSDIVQKSPHKARPHNNLSQALIRVGRFEESIAHARKALSIQPDYAQAHNNLARALIETGQIGEGIVQARETLKLRPDYADAHNNLAVALIKSGQLEEAIVHFQEALRLDPDQPSVRKNLQRALEEQRQGKQEAPAQSPKGPPMPPGDPVSHYQLGHAYQAEGRLAEAMEQYRQALALQPGFLPALNDLALAYASQGEYEQALPLYRQMTELRPDSYVAYYNMACLYAQQGRIEESLASLEEAVARGFSDWQFLKEDKDLENIRDTGYFKTLTGSLD